MAVNDHLIRNEMEIQSGQTLVRRFTDGLVGVTTIERAAISVKPQSNELASTKAEFQVRRLLQDDENGDSVFHEAETARLKLEMTCKQFEDSGPSTTLKAGFRRDKKQTRADEMLRPKIGDDFVQLKQYVDEQESKWKKQQISVFKRFRSICSTLDNHRSALAIFPTQNTYASVLCGSIKCIIRAAANHDEVSDVISETVASITQTASRAAKALILVKTGEMRYLVSQLYAQVFRFYRDAMEWYMRSRISRLFSSFNEKLKERYEDAASKIEKTVREIYSETNLAHFALNQIQHAEQTRDSVMRQRQQTPYAFASDFAGLSMHKLLFDTHRTFCIEGTDKVQRTSTPFASESRSSKRKLANRGLLNRKAIRNSISTFENFVIGTEGYALLKEGNFWLPQSESSFRLRAWMGQDHVSPMLWMSSPEETAPDQVPSSRAAALSLLVAAWEVEMPVISHFCERPRMATLAEDRDVEKVGLVGLVYSLIAQLLQFDWPEDDFQFTQEREINLDGSDASWPHALRLLSALLEATPHLRFCVIDGINNLSFSGGAEWCGEYLSLLLAHQRSVGDFRILFTTSGQSRVLPGFVDVADRVFVQSAARQIIRGGKWVEDPRGQRVASSEEDPAS